jgi:hypothetical protein
MSATRTRNPVNRGAPYSLTWRSCGEYALGTTIYAISLCSPTPTFSALAVMKPTIQTILKAKQPTYHQMCAIYYYNYFMAIKRC